MTVPCALVLLSGMNCSADLWRDLELEQLPGISEVITPELDRDSVPEQVEELLLRLPDRFLLGGLSLGAIVAMALAVREPQRVAGLLLVSTNAKGPTSAQRAGWADMIRDLDDGTSPRELQQRLLGVLLSESARSGEPDLVERTLAMADATGPARLRSQLRLQATREDLREGLRSVPAPALVVSGTQDALCPPSFHEEIAAALPQSRLEQVPAGHLLPLEQPAAVRGLVQEWWGSAR